MNTKNERLKMMSEKLGIKNEGWIRGREIINSSIRIMFVSFQKERETETCLANSFVPLA